MQFFKDITQAEPVYRDFPLKENTTFTNGAAVLLNTTAGAIYAAPQASTWINTLGVYVGATQTTGSTRTIANGTNVLGKVIVNPFAVYLAEYDQSTTFSATGFSTATVTATHECQAGDWLLNVTSAGAAKGYLGYLTSTSTTTTATFLSTPSVAHGATDTYVHVHAIGKGQAAAQYSRIDLNSTATKIKTGTSYGGVGIQVLDNHVKSNLSTSLQPLRVASHNNTTDTTYKVFGEIMFVDNVWVKI